MYKFSSYLVCHDELNHVKLFLSQFLEEEIGKFNHSEWITFLIPNSELVLNLMIGEQQPLTQNFTLEISCRNINQLRELAHKQSVEINRFQVTKTEEPYIYNYITILGPAGICKLEAFFCEFH